MNEHQQVKDVAEALASEFGHAPDWAIIAGSGLASISHALTNPKFVPYSALTGLPRPTVSGHSGQVAVGVIGASRTAVFCGRIHVYEHGGVAPSIRIIRALGLWGCSKIILTNAAGGLNPSFEVGDLMLIADQINFMFRSPLRGATQFGQRFVDLSYAYDSQYREWIRDLAVRLGITLHEGVYAANVGPAFETPAEARMLSRLGADAVGMSTAPEVIAARQINMRVVGISLISNSLVKESTVPASHEEVLANSQQSAQKMVQIVQSLIEEERNVANAR